MSRIHTLDLKNTIVWVEVDDHFNHTEFEGFSNKLMTLGAKSVVFTTGGIKLNLLDDEKLKKMGLQKIKEEK